MKECEKCGAGEDFSVEVIQTGIFVRCACHSCGSTTGRFLSEEMARDAWDNGDFMCPEEFNELVKI